MNEGRHSCLSAVATDHDLSTRSPASGRWRRRALAALAGSGVMLSAAASFADQDDAALRCTQVSFPVSLAAGQPADRTVVGWMCTRGSIEGKTIQVLLHGGTYDHSYWDFPLMPDQYSYAVRAATGAGYVTLNLDRLGSGLSSHPDPDTLTLHVERVRGSPDRRRPESRADGRSGPRPRAWRASHAGRALPRVVHLGDRGFDLRRCRRSSSQRIFAYRRTGHPGRRVLRISGRLRSEVRGPRSALRLSDHPAGHASDGVLRRDLRRPGGHRRGRGAQVDRRRRRASATCSRPTGRPSVSRCRRSSPSGISTRSTATPRPVRQARRSPRRPPTSARPPASASWTSPTRATT